MDKTIEYQRAKQGDERHVFDFISRVFNQFVAPEYSREGIEEFMSYIHPDALSSYLRSNHFGLIAAMDSEIIGVVYVRDYNHIALFFVDPAHQRKGIGNNLLQRALGICIRHEAKTSKITVNASPNAIDAYKKLNFAPTDKERCVNGIRFIPMALRLRQSGSV